MTPVIREAKADSRTTESSASSPTVVQQFPPLSKIIARTKPSAGILAGILILAAWIALINTLATGSTERALALGMVTLATLTPVLIWAYGSPQTIPLVAVLSLQDYMWYGLPLIINNKEIHPYPPEDLVTASVSILIYSLSMTVVWLMIVKRPTTIPGTIRILSLTNMTSRKRTISLAAFGLACCALFELALVVGWTDPLWKIVSYSAVINPIRTLLAAVECGACLLLFHEIGAKRLGSIAIFITVASWLTIFLMRIASVLLSSTVTTIASMALGLFLGSRRMPWLPTSLAILLLFFLNLSKFDVRERYWSDRADRVRVTVSTLPEFFLNWSMKSLDILLGQTSQELQISQEPTTSAQSPFERISNLQMLLYVNHRLQRVGDDLLWGKTYSVVPSVLVPRVFWSDKPKAQIGQVILNVHFGRQTLRQTNVTYIAWGPLPESVGNFGPWWGPLLLGTFFGTAFGYIERKTYVLPLFSPASIMAGFLCMTLVSLPSMVASTYISSVTQLLFVLWIGLALMTTQTPYNTSSDSV